VSNEVRIIVVAENQTKQGLAQGKRDAEVAGKETGAAYGKGFTTSMQDIDRTITTTFKTVGEAVGEQVTNATTGALRDSRGRFLPAASKAGERIGDEMGKSMARRIYERLRSIVTRDGGGSTAARSGGIPDKDTDRKDTASSGFSGLVKKAGSAGADAAKSFGDKFGSGLSGFFTSSLLGQIVTAGAIAIGAVLAPALLSIIAAAISSGLLVALGGGVIALGVVQALKDPTISAAVKELKGLVGKGLEDFGKPFKPYMADFLEDLAGLLKRIMPDLKQLGEEFAPVFGQLAHGLVDLLGEAMPGILAAVEASKPLLETLAKHMPAIGEAISQFFGIISEQGDDANLFFGDLLRAIEWLLPAIANAIAFFTSMYSTVRNVIKNSIALFNELRNRVTNSVNSIYNLFSAFGRRVASVLMWIYNTGVTAFSWIRSIGGWLGGAMNAFGRFGNYVSGVLSWVRGMAAATASVVSNVLGGIGFAHGGIVGAAASGGIRNGMTMVGEGGPELVELPPGTRVHSAGDTKRKLADGNGGNGGEFVFRFDTGGDPLLSAIVKSLRSVVAAQGGNVQIVLGR
jgi:hypothetical protein